MLIALSLVAASAAGLDTLARWAATLLGGRLLDSRVSIDELSSDLRPTCLLVGDATIANPAGFPGDPMVTIERAQAHYRLGSLVRSPLHVTRMDIQIAEITVVKNQRGDLNLDPLCERLRDLGNDRLKIDHLTLSLDSVRYEDHSLGPKPHETTVWVGLDSVVFRDVTAPGIAAALSKVALVSKYGPGQLFKLREAWRRLVTKRASPAFGVRPEPRQRWDRRSRCEPS